MRLVYICHSSAYLGVVVQYFTSTSAHTELTEVLAKSQSLSNSWDSTYYCYQGGIPSTDSTATAVTAGQNFD